jgi:hypothetical protein
MIPRRLRRYWDSGTQTKSQDIHDYSAYLASQRADSGARTSGGGSNRAQNISGGMTKSKVGPAVGVYDPEWASWLAEESL